MIDVGHMHRQHSCPHNFNNYLIYLTETRLTRYDRQHAMLDFIRHWLIRGFDSLIDSCHGNSTGIAILLEGVFSLFSSNVLSSQNKADTGYTLDIFIESEASNGLG